MYKGFILSFLMVFSLSVVQAELYKDIILQEFPEFVKDVMNRAKQGDSEAQFMLGWMYDLGQGVPVSDRGATYWYKKAAEQGYAPAQFDLARQYETGRGVIKNEQEALRLYKEAAMRGSDKAQFRLGEMYEFGYEGIDIDFEEAAKWYEEAAMRGHMWAQYALFKMYTEGRGVLRYLQTAYAWLILASSHNMGLSFEEQRADLKKLLSKSDIAKAKKKSQTLARKIEENQKRTFETSKEEKSSTEDQNSDLIKRAQKGDVLAQHKLGTIYYDDGLWGFDEEGYEKAVFWWTRATKKDHVDSQYQLGKAYFEGKGVPQDSKEAAYWWEKVAEQGHLEAQEMLGSLIYMSGMGVPKDLIKAYAWLDVASSQDSSYKIKRDELAKLMIWPMSFFKITKAKKLSKEIIETIELNQKKKLASESKSSGNKCEDNFGNEQATKEVTE